MDQQAPLAESGVEIDPQALVRLYADDVWRYVSAKLRHREDAEDAAMETFAHAIQHIHRVRKADSPKLWLLAVARNKAHDALRKRYRRAESPLDARPEVPLDEAPPHRDELQQALSELPHRQREALILMYVNGLGVRELALAIRKSEAATNSLLQRARQAMRDRLPHLIEASGGNP